MALHASTSSQVIAPCDALSQCVRAYVSRCTLGATLKTSQRHNHFPASAACSITWFMHGSSRRVHDPQALPSTVLFRGPHTRPVTTVNTGPVQMFVLLLMPDALQAIANIDAGQHLNRLCPADKVFDPHWMALLHAVGAAADDTHRVQLIEAFLAPRWLAACGGTGGHAGRYTPWASALATRAASTGSGRSSRQLERRVLAWTGLPMRTLRGLCRAEEGFLKALHLAAQHTGLRIPWAEVALEAGYADQAHMCREVRRLTGFSPQALWRHTRNDEAFWVYRTWR
jgi:AraC-like DNA-binding protein